ncbi:uncharacterized protein AMSG_10126 [Thecamonas trahens ATCC 50062]|uniref:Pex N-terminal domain-containing protein n=1 Tax=Thecamonas trahens ATCC 50062 TaxID=461836 RepID=A0A0L0DSH4_THETB|nr:hypothetical protein AMSG_10126 [Thecamonas trahens ATCC 50062]KNC54403.1 hypothetical protein AMSG_10126 [Thecamonas trahens ATCC 50062]|eukprot:XP_013753701.1 hypothetical protein AMSG_10126 [Thecamonas trahens ATCC 50062]
MIRPTVFEVWAQRALSTTLPAGCAWAVDYVSGKVSSATGGRVAGVEALVGRRRYAAWALRALIESHHMVLHHGSFAESFYGMRRRSADASCSDRSLSLIARILAALIDIALPIVKAAADEWYEDVRGVVAPAEISGLEAWQIEDEVVQDGSHLPERAAEVGPDVDEVWARREASWRWLMWMVRVAWRRMGRQAVVAIYPALHAVYVLAFMLYEVLYLNKMTDYASPVLHLLGQQLVRSSAAELEASLSLSSLILPSAVAAYAPSALVAALDALKYAFPASVLGHRMVSWWSSRDETNAAPLPVPAPPPPPAGTEDVARGGCAICGALGVWGVSGDPGGAADG